MERFQLTIQLGNDGAQTKSDVYDILKEVADKINFRDDTEGKIIDNNGNTVGEYSFQ